jgi:pyridoxine 5-phosphate synthase
MTHLSVNINKIATLRNSRGGNNPDLLKVALDCESFGAQGITVHPRPDERHIRYQDVYDLKENIHTEFNIEGNPKEQKFVDLVLATKPAQVTLVPDARVSIFVDPNVAMVQGAAKTGTDRIELYTEAYAREFAKGNKEAAVLDYTLAAASAKELGLGINAGHDLDRFNLAYLVKSIPYIDEVSIGHALICDALYLGLENTIQLYKRALS